MPTPKFDVFLSHKSSDKPAVEEIARKLVQEGLTPWLDKWNLIPGDPWQVAIEEVLANCATCAVFIGPSGIGPWHNEEMRAAISRRVNESQGSFRVIPVLLPGATREERSKLPTFLVTTMWVEFRQMLDDEEAFRRLICGIRGIAPGPGIGEAVYEGVCPYRGLQVFDVEHAPFFFGREALTEWLLNELRSPKTPGVSTGENRFLGIIGASGSGKSSLARAGLMAALKQGKLPGSESWPMAIFRPGADPLESLVTALSGLAKLNPSDALRLKEDLAKHETLLHLTTRMALHEAPVDRRVVILVDQFEEVFTLCQNETFRKGLIDNLIYAATVAEGKTVVMLTLRADFYGKCAAYPTLAAALSDHQMLVGGMTDEELRLAIERPAQLAGGEFEPGLVEVLLKDMRDQAGGLPLLQFALLELWNQRTGRRLTQAAYIAIGGVEGALEKRAETVFQQFTEAEQHLCRDVFLRLTQTGETTETTKRRAALAELLPAQGNREQIEAVIQQLSSENARLITVESNPLPGGAGVGTVEVAHEALIRGWKRLKGWIDADKEFLLWRQRLRASVEEWQRTRQDEAVLLRGGPLAEAERWFQERPDNLSADEQQFIQTGIALRQREHVARERTRRRNLMAMTAGLIITITLLIVGVIAGIFWYNSERNRRRSEMNAVEAQRQQVKAKESRWEAERQSVISLAQSLIYIANQLTQKGERERASLLTRQAYLLNQRYRGQINDQIDAAFRLILLDREGATDALATQVCQKVTRNLTLEEWRQVVGDGIPYEPCPGLADAPGGSKFTLHLRSAPIIADESQKLSFNLDPYGNPVTDIANEFEDRGEVVVDHVTGLMWQKSGSEDSLTYEQAQAYVTQLNDQRFAGYADWRLPTIEELLSLLELKLQSNDLYINPMFDTKQFYVWSADIKRIKDDGSSIAAYHVLFNLGLAAWNGLLGHEYVLGNDYVRAVRSWQ